MKGPRKQQLIQTEAKGLHKDFTVNQARHFVIIPEITIWDRQGLSKENLTISGGYFYERAPRLLRKS